MHKKLNGRTLAAMAVAAMTAGISAPAMAERIELTFTGTLTGSWSTMSCWGCEIPAPVEQLITPLSFSQTLIIEIGGAANISGTSVYEYPGLDIDGRDTWNVDGAQTMGQTNRSGIAPASIAPAELLSWAGASLPGGPAAEEIAARRTRMLTTYPDGAAPDQRRDVWDAYRSQTWLQADGSYVAQSVQLFHWMPYPVTVGNVGEALTTRQFVERLQSDFWCTGCLNSLIVNASTGNDSSSRNFYYFGELTAFNARVLSASAVPEPSTYALMLAGVAVVGVMVRRKRAIRS